MKKAIIAVTGMPGSGKSLFAEKLATLGYEQMMLSRILKQRIESRSDQSIPSDYWRESLEIRKKHGDDILARIAWDDLVARNIYRAVFDGIRCLAEAAFLQKKADIFLLVSIQAAPATRQRRLMSSSHGFYENLERIAQLDAHELKLGIGNVISVSDIIIFLPEMDSDRLETYLMSKANEIHMMLTSRGTDAKLKSDAHRSSYLQTLSTFI